MKMTGFNSPAEAARAEIERLKAEQSNPSVEETTEDEASVEEEDTLTVEEDDESVDFPESIETPRTSEDKDVEYWKQRFNVMEGKYRAETQAMRQDIYDLKELVQSLKSQPTPSQETAQAKIDALEEEYGPEFTEAVDQRIKRILKEQLGDVQKDITQVKTSQQQTEAERFEANLDTRAENWRKINTDPSFIAWLQTEEPTTGIKYHTSLLSHYNNRDVDKVARIFNFYSKNTKKPVNQPPVNDAAEELIAPPKRGSQTQNTIEVNDARIYKLADVNQFYREIRDGKYTGKPDYVKKMKAIYRQAHIEGRISG